MATIASLIVRIGAQDAEITSVLGRVGKNAADTDAALKKLGNTPLAQQAQKSLADFDATLKQIQTSQQNLANRATLAAQGLEAVGGAGKLTKTELDAVNRTLQQGLDAFRALGQDAPKELEKVAAAVKVQQQRIDESGKSTGLLSRAQGALIEQLAILAGPAALGLVAKEALAYADTLTKMSERTGIGVDALQRLQAIAEPSGNTIEELANAVNKMQKNIAGGDQNAVEALHRLGIEMGAFTAMSPDEQFIAIAKGIQKIPDPANQALIAVQLFGRSGAELLPTLKANVDKLADSTVRMSAESVEALHHFSEEFGRLKTSAVNVVGEILSKFGTIAGAVEEAAKRAGSAVEDLSKRPGIGKILQGFSAFASGAGDVSGGPQGLGEIKSSFQAPPLTGAPLGGSIGVISGQAPQATNAIQAMTAALRAQQAVAEHLGLSLDEYEHKLDEVNQKIRLAEQDEGNLTFLQQQRALTLKQLGLTEEDISIALGVSALAIKKYLEGFEASIRSMDEFQKEGAKAAESTTKLTFGFNSLGKAVEGFHGLPRVGFELTGFIDDATLAANALKALQEQTAKTHAALSSQLTVGLLPDLKPQNLDAIKDATKGFSFGDLFGSLKDKLDPTKIISGAAGNLLSGGISSLVNGAVSGIGALIGKIASIGGPSKEEVAGRQTEAQFEQQMGGIAGIGKALTQAGLSADEANAKILALFAAEKQGSSAVQVAIDGINKTISDHTTLVSTGLTDILAAAQTVGTNFPDALKPVVEQLSALPGLTDDEKKALLGLVTDGAPSLDQLTSTAAKYGLTLDDLGPKTQQLDISKKADDIISDFNLLSKSGADTGSVINHMAGSVSGLVDEAIKFGGSLPTALKPIAEALLNAGLLTDDNGKKLGDLSNIKFDDSGDPLAQGLLKLTDALNHLSDLLSNKLPADAKTAASGIADALGSVSIPEINVPVHFDIPDLPHFDGSRVSTGGRVLSTGVEHFAGGGAVLPFLPRGTDTVPAMLTPGEVVLNAAQQRNLATALTTASLGGNSTARLEAKFDALGRVLADQQRRLPELIALQIAAAIAKAA